MSNDPRQHPFHQRYRQSGVMARDVRASAEIDAPIEAVWATLVDFDAYPQWNPFTTSAETSLVVGDPVALHVSMPGRSKSVRTEWVNLVEPGRTICWGMHLGHPSLLCANRWQVLDDLGRGRTRYETVDRFSGVLVPMVMAIYAEPMRLGFELMARALKSRVEQMLKQDGDTT